MAKVAINIHLYIITGFITDLLLLITPMKTRNNYGKHRQIAIRVTSSDRKVVDWESSAIILKVFNARYSEYLQSITNDTTRRGNKTTDAYVGLRVKLKTYAIKKQAPESSYHITFIHHSQVHCYKKRKRT